MGTSRTPAYRVETRSVGCRNYAETPMEWRVRSTRSTTGYGRPNKENLQKFVDCTNASMEPGGANEHLRKNDPAYRIVGARIVRQSDGEVMAEVGSMKQPMFEVI